MTPYVLILGSVFFLSAYGVHRRAVWAWWGGWVIFYLMAGGYSTFAFPALEQAQTATATLAAAVYIAGGAVILVPAAAWWGTHRHFFGRATKTSARKVDSDSRNR